MFTAGKYKAPRHAVQRHPGRRYTVLMVAVLVFAVCLFIAVLVSKRANRTVLSTAVIFLFAGFFAGDAAFGFVSLAPDDPVVVTFAGLALFSVLFTDGMRVGLRDLASAWRLPGRALLLGLPLTLLGNALLAYYVAGLPWAESFLIGAVLSPTDPVFSAALGEILAILWLLLSPVWSLREHPEAVDAG